MKKLLLALACITLVGCGKGWDPLQCQQFITEEYKTREVMRLPNSWDWIVRNEKGEVRLITMGAGELKVTRDILIFQNNE